MLEYKSINGQSLMDVCLSTYGNLDFMLKLIQDNDIPNINYRPTSGQIFLWNETVNIDETVNRVSHNGNIAYCTGVPQKDEASVELTDLDILRQIRDANPTSQLPALWLDSEDPYTQWERVTWDNEKTKVTELYPTNAQLTSIDNVNKLNDLVYLDINNNQISNIDVSGMVALTTLRCHYNLLTSISTLTSKGNITQYSFIMNNLPISETDRLIALGFESQYVLPQN